MSENINGQDLLASGSHQWLWGDKERASKSLGTPGAAGVYSYLISTGARPGRIVGTLASAGEDVAACDAAIDLLEKAIEDLCDLGTELTWEDDRGHSGTHLVLLAYRRMSGRTYAASGKTCWQQYALEIRENRGALSA